MTVLIAVAWSGDAACCVAGSGKQLTITDAKGNMAHITIANVYQKNGVILVVDKVLLPN